ncbi:MAG: flagellar basal body-associated FliL family protein [Alphaproteobacteria bacterium]|nr:flagellar basal body-associated FliL family protein [Alphaproteobacteria bacterium]
MATITRDPPAARRRTRKAGRWVVMLAGLVVVAAGAAGGWYYWQHRKTTVVEAPPQPIYVVIKPFVVTMLDDNQTTRFVQVGVDLEVTDKAAKERVEQALPAIQDAIRLQVLQSKVAEVTSPQGVEQLRKLLIVQANNTVNSIMPLPADPHTPPAKPGQAPPPPVHNVFFTELVVE